MKLFLIAQSHNKWFNTFDSAVVAAPDEETAKNMYPGDGEPMDWDYIDRTWCVGPEHVSVTYLGEAENHVEFGVICASFNAG